MKLSCSMFKNNIVSLLILKTIIIRYQGKTHKQRQTLSDALAVRNILKF